MKALLLALLISPLCAQTPCAISGTVIDQLSGRPVVHAKVFAQSGDTDDQDEPLPAVRRLSDASGHFCFERLTTGSYTIIASKAGYLEAKYGASHPSSAALRVEVESGQPVPPLVLKMEPQTVIGGVVTDSDGDPVSFAEVRLWKRSRLGDRPSTVNAREADDRGNFRLSKLAPGTYYISATVQRWPRSGEMISRTSANSLDNNGQPFPEREIETFYRASLTIREATPVTVKAGQEISGVTIPIQKAPSRRIMGRVLWDVQASENPMIWLVRPNEGLNGTIRLEKDGSFHAEGLAPGVYTLMAQGPNQRLSAHKEVDVTAGDADGILLEPVETFELKVSLHVEGSKAELHMDFLTLMPHDSPNGQSGAENDDGTWQFGSLQPDVYHLFFWPKSDEYYVKRVVLDGTVQEGTTLDLRGHRPQSAEVVLAPSTSSVTGQVSNRKDAVPASTLVLMKETVDDDAMTWRIEAAAAGGHFA
ncbi:MAG: carboxypeptidase regulatory-like domain-containing protein, partial [Acidobacteriaceae bacterium]|nr:carboxypeptidase regulatory-like domain-containing protein [Acidobacteriaceae bacterium]